MKYEHLFSSIKVNGLMLKNHIVAAPIGEKFIETALGGATHKDGSRDSKGRDSNDSCRWY